MELQEEAEPSEEQIEDAKLYFLSRVDNKHPLIGHMNKETIARIMIDYAEGYFHEKTRMLKARNQ